ncbi:hypothetical protein COX73_00350 [bacterium (Candidatus Gribaldobacteria) CG_4_10_14_0_2_um_filter_36_18]|uniref:DUF11 domain-containing protein n=1 Tax=bacterium (Candidatus Gribaldobacteria) CG_4_10_14_0_2_um_filter_36_18 TaxID=2014264 RepID=A0A2M7VL03_9BACT|nr:MAG: hypothetical protein COX73_00350 [bacterium (Candidatus Gribaldobacteria) CG_4_10_14_0_2_um_filter_36_18]
MRKGRAFWQGVEIALFLFFSLIKLIIEKMLAKIKEKLKIVSSFFRARELSEQAALVATILAFVSILAVFLLVINFVLPKTRVEVRVSGPEKAKCGEEIIYTVTYKNTGNVILEQPELTFHHPTFSLPEKTLVETKSLGNYFYPKEEKTFEFKTRLFGAKGEKREVKTWLTYSTERKKAPAMTEVVAFSTLISETPIDLILDIPAKIPISPKTETEFIFRIKYLSLIEPAISNLKLVVNFPSDFKFKESKPARTEKQNWQIAKLEKLESGELEISGTFPREEKLDKELDFMGQLLINLQGEDVLLKEVTTRSITYEPIFLLTQKINGQEKYSPYPGEKLHYQIYFKNIQDKPLRDLVLTTVLEGNIYDIFTIETPSGKFKMGDNSISWDGEDIPQLRYLLPGEQGEAEFWVRLKDDYKPKDLTETNVLIKNRVILAGFEAEFRNQVNSKITISQEGYFRDKYGFFENSGQHPPQVNETTYYTIVWKFGNYYNRVEDVKIKAALPDEVHFNAVKTTHGEVKVIRKAEVESLYPEIPTGFKFEKPLYQEMNGDDVKYLQIILKSEVSYLYPENVGASGHFGPTTLKSVKGFQLKYKEEILDPQNLKEPTGYVDELTRLKLNELLIKGIPSGPTEVVWEIGEVDPGIGVLEDPWIATFQIAFTPQAAQRGKEAILIHDVTASAKDRWTGMFVNSNNEFIDTTLPDDPTVRGEGKIR